MKIYEHPYYGVKKNPNEQVLSFYWNEAHSEMSYEDFKEACCNYAGYAFEYQAKRLLIDTSNFQFQMPADFEQWRDDHHYPRLWKLGVEKMAFLMPESVMAFVEDKAAEFGKFPVRYFVQEGEAMEWLGE